MIEGRWRFKRTKKRKKKESKGEEEVERKIGYF